MDSEFLFEEDIMHDYDNHTCIRLTVNEFRGVEYMSLREYYEDFDSSWKPTRKGITVPLTLELVNNLQDALDALRRA